MPPMTNAKRHDCSGPQNQTSKPMNTIIHTHMVDEHASDDKCQEIRLLRPTESQEGAYKYSYEHTWWMSMPLTTNAKRNDCSGPQNHKSEHLNTHMSTPGG